MDFDALNTRADAERGAILHLKHPQLKHPLYAGEGADSHGRLIDESKAKPVTVRILGAEAPAFRAAFEAWQKLSDSARAEPSKMAGFLAKVVTSIDGVARKVNGEIVEVKPDAEGLAYLISRSDNFGAQMIDFAIKSENFFVDGLGE